MPHFFVDSRNRLNNFITINDNENYRHIARALRARVGEKLLLIDEAQIQYETKIIEINSSEIICEIEKNNCGCFSFCTYSNKFYHNNSSKCR